jgi:hypothetical protein
MKQETQVHREIVAHSTLTSLHVEDVKDTLTLLTYSSSACCCALLIFSSRKRENEEL